MISDLQSAQSTSLCLEPSPAERRRRLQILTWEDVDLMARVAQRDVSAFGLLYDKFSTPMFSLGFRIVRSRPEAEDVLQEVFCKIWSCATSYRQHLGSPFTWVATITRRRAIDRLRRQVRRGNTLKTELYVPTEIGADSGGPVPLIATEDRRDVRSALATIGHVEQRVIALAFFEGLTHAEIAVVLEIPMGTVKARIRRGMFKLRAKLAALGY